jgi:hypothetical protein
MTDNEAKEHNCDEMGCSSVGSHVVERAQSGRLAMLRVELAAWRYVAQAFRDATGAPAIEARDGEYDPWLERAQNLYNQVANTYGTPGPNRFACATCETGSAVVDEDGCCKSCGADTIPVFDPDAE